MFADFSDLTAHDRYKLLSATVMPRPIALVTTQSKAGVLNAAPFSFFNVFSEDPALAVLGLETRRDNDRIKDTTANIAATGALVINLVDRALAGPMVACAASLGPEEDELTFAGLTALPSRKVSVPGIAEAPVRLECTLFELRQITARRHLCIAEVQAITAREGIIDPDTFHVSLDAYRPIGRLMGQSYAELGEVFEIAIPPAPGKEAS
ncbi:flavin reductase (DIM6/NTAB) family NADH-FMN oxidoreductase RutF [Litoreibacter ponti]|uniref:Flavin reductase (DIM6/NTAB) family NADH-FMN oxidoreductase RutF n=1 Tax=Litoreibacter ponti TaxID=1510457 RepID=A0A2T6BHA9_9RHOB|nr:flavin reductase family protein [Litoreibacter ponti]PTX55453.1 flavin reductase (DIM6/NTAB) family NADH-FMN oxidoreductase RutF [Litoreibacter ponti]